MIVTEKRRVEEGAEAAQEVLRKTYILGFDEQLGGGIPSSHIVLLAGTSGTMKTSVAYSMIYNCAKFDGLNAVFVSLEQTRSSLLYQIKKLGMSEPTRGNIRILDLTVIRKEMARHQNRKPESWLEDFQRIIESIGEQREYQLLVIDSLPALELIANFKEPREELFSLFQWIKDQGATTLLLSEMTPESDAYGKYDESFLADGIIHLQMKPVNDIDIERRIRCVKMRGMDHAMGYFRLLFREGRFQITRAISS